MLPILWPHRTDVNIGGGRGGGGVDVDARVDNARWRRRLVTLVAAIGLVILGLAIGGHLSSFLVGIMPRIILARNSRSIREALCHCPIAIVGRLADHAIVDRRVVGIKSAVIRSCCCRTQPLLGGLLVGGGSGEGKRVVGIIVIVVAGSWAEGWRRHRVRGANVCER